MRIARHKLPKMRELIYPRPHASANETSHAADSTISSRQAHSSGEWGAWAPQERFGVGSPISVSREPSVPPRTIVRRAVRPRVPGPVRRSQRPGAPGPALRPCSGIGGVTATSTLTPGKLVASVPAVSPQKVGLLGQSRRSKSRNRMRTRTSATPPCNLVGVQEAVAALGGFRRQSVARQPVDELGRHADGVGHPPLGNRGMDVDARES